MAQDSSPVLPGYHSIDRTSSARVAWVWLPRMHVVPSLTSDARIPGRPDFGGHTCDAMDLRWTQTDA